jgi:hypothetical protein
MSVFAKLLLASAIVATASALACDKEVQQGLFTTFNSGTTNGGCEKRSHMLWEFEDEDCVWTSDDIPLQKNDEYVFESMNAKFKAKELGNVEMTDKDFIEISMHPCSDGICEAWQRTKKVRGDSDDFKDWERFSGDL